VPCLRHQHLFAAEGQQLLRQTGGALAGLLDLLERSVPGGEVARPPRLVTGQRFGCIPRHGVEKHTLVAALWDQDPYLSAALRGEQLLHELGTTRQGGYEDQWRYGPATLDGRHVRRDLLGVQLEQERLHQLRLVAFIGPIGHPAPLALHAPVTYVEDLYRDLELVDGHSHHVSVGPVREDDRVALEDLVERPELVTDDRRAFVLHVVGRNRHLGLKAALDHLGLAAHEGAEVVGDLAMGLGGDAADAGRGALADVAEQAGAA